MSYYKTLEVLAICDAIDKVPQIRQTLEDDGSSKRPLSYPTDRTKLKIPKIDKPVAQHDFLDLDSIFKDKKQHPVPKSYNDQAIRSQLLSSSEAANSIQRKNILLNGLQSAIKNDIRQVQPSSQTLSIQQQRNALQMKKALQNQHFQNSPNRLANLNTPSTLQNNKLIPPSQSPNLSQPRPIHYQPSPNHIHTPQPTKTPPPSSGLQQQQLHHVDGYNTPRTSQPNSNPGSRPSTPGRTPHNAGTTSYEVGYAEICDFCEREFRGPKSSTHKQQHIKRIHPEEYVRKKGGVKKPTYYTTTRF